MFSIEDGFSSSGPFTLRAISEGTIVCDLPVDVVWLGHESQPEAFLGIKSDDPEELRAALDAFVGRPVKLEFTRRTRAAETTG